MSSLQNNEAARAGASSDKKLAEESWQIEYLPGHFSLAPHWMPGNVAYGYKFFGIRSYENTGHALPQRPVLNQRSFHTISFQRNELRSPQGLYCDNQTSLLGRGLVTVPVVVRHSRFFVCFQRFTASRTKRTKFLGSSKSDFLETPGPACERASGGRHCRRVRGRCCQRSF
jgi:hypothetical protein